MINYQQSTTKKNETRKHWLIHSYKYADKFTCPEGIFRTNPKCTTNKNAKIFKRRFSYLYLLLDFYYQ